RRQREARRRARGTGRIQAREHDADQRVDGDQRHDHEQRVVHRDLAARRGGVHVSCPRSSTRFSPYVTAKTMSIRMMPRGAADPTWLVWNRRRHTRYAGTVVAVPGPPLVIT